MSMFAKYTKAEFRAKQKECFDKLEAGEILDIGGMLLVKYVYNPESVHKQEIEDVHTEKETVPVAETPVVTEKKTTIEELRAQINNIETPVLSEPKPPKYVLVDAYSLGDTSVGYGEKQIKMLEEEAIRKKVSPTIYTPYVEETAFDQLPKAEVVFRESTFTPNTGEAFFKTPKKKK